MINQPFNVFKDTLEIQVVPLLKKRTQGALGWGGVSWWRLWSLKILSSLYGCVSKSAFKFSVVSTDSVHFGWGFGCLSHFWAPSNDKSWHHHWKQRCFYPQKVSGYSFYQFVVAQYICSCEVLSSLVVSQQHEKHHLKWVSANQVKPPLM